MILVKGYERVSYGWVDPRAVFGNLGPDYWRVIWMAVSCCCGIEGETQPVSLPAPERHGVNHRLTVVPKQAYSPNC